MNVWKKVAITLGVVGFGIPLVIAGLFIYTTSDMCGNEVYSEVISPNRELKAVVFQRDCGATTGFSTQISILDSDQDLKNVSGNIYIIDGHPNDVAPPIQWVSATELKIERIRNGSEYKAESSWGVLNKIKVTYVASSS
jgi:hypothetical protein